MPPGAIQGAAMKLAPKPIPPPAAMAVIMISLGQTMIPDSAASAICLPPIQIGNGRFAVTDRLRPPARIGAERVRDVDKDVLMDVLNAGEVCDGDIGPGAAASLDGSGAA